jgi:hypothetical protein
VANPPATPTPPPWWQQVINQPGIHLANPTEWGADQPPQQGATGGGGFNSNTGGTAQINPSINPQAIYSPEMTKHAVNQAVAANTPDLRSAMKMFDRPGLSRSAGTVSAAMPFVAEQALAGRQAASEIPLRDEIANQRHLLSGEVAREGEVQGLYDLLNRLNSLNQRNYLSDLNRNLSLADSLFGG